MDVKLPKLGEGADSGVVVNVFVKEGDAIAKGQAILELENEKAVASIPSTAAGAVTAIFVKNGDRISVGQKLISVNESGAAASAPTATAKPATKKSTPTSEPEEESVETDEDSEISNAAPIAAHTPAISSSAWKV